MTTIMMEHPTKQSHFLLSFFSSFREIMCERQIISACICQAKCMDAYSTQLTQTASGLLFHSSFVMRYFRFVDFLAHHCIYYSFRFNPDFMAWRFFFFCRGHILSGVIMLLSRAHVIVNVYRFGC